MHELSLCEALAGAVVRRAEGRAVRRATVRVGHLRQVVPDTMTFCWGVLTDGTDLDGCELDVEHVPAVVVCRACGERTTLALPVLACGSCDGSDLELESGDELVLVSIDVVGVG